VAGRAEVLCAGMSKINGQAAVSTEDSGIWAWV